MKRRTCLLILLLLLLCAAQAEENLFVNGGFSDVSDGMPVGWTKEMYRTDTGISKLFVDADGYDGNCICVTNIDSNDARFTQTVSVEPDTIYRISGMIKAENCDAQGYGATLSIGGLFVYSDSIFDSEGEWRYVELYGETGPDQTTLTVFARVGGYGYESRGTAWFDDLEIVRVEDPPEDEIVYAFYQDTTVQTASRPSDDGQPQRYTETLLLFIAIYALAVLAIVRKRNRSDVTPDSSTLITVFVCGLYAALFLRLFIAVQIRGYKIDVDDFSAWSEAVYANGITHFYCSGIWCDYPPGYMFLLWFVSAFRQLLGIALDSKAYLVLLKFMPIACDLIGSVILYRVALHRFDRRASVVIGLLYAFNPAAIANASAWGQIDAVLTLFIALCALDAARECYWRSLTWFGLALLIKPQALLFAPLGLFAILLNLISSCIAAEKQKDRKARQNDFNRWIYKLISFLAGAVICIGLMYAAAFVACAGQTSGMPDRPAYTIRWLIDQYRGTMQDGYRYFTVNTLNIWYILGLNWKALSSNPDTQLLAWVCFGASYVVCMALMICSRKKPRRLLLVGALLITLICTFGPMIHERYLFPAMLLLALAFALEKDRRLLISLVVMTCTLTLNELLVLQGGMGTGNYGHLQESERWLNNALSWINVANAVFMLWTSLDICATDTVYAVDPLPGQTMPTGALTLNQPSRYRLHLKRVDALLMASVTLLYSVVAFWNLGTTRAPQSGWVSSASGESVVLDLGGVQTWRMVYYGGICTSTFSVELSNDGETWTEPTYAEYNQGQIFRWLWFVPHTEQTGSSHSQSTIYSDTLPSLDGSAYLTYASISNPYPLQSARYIRLTAQSAGLTLYEVAFLDVNDTPLDAQIIDHSGQAPDSESDASALLDEADTVAAVPSYLNSTYFDEIYHARTAYEHLHGMNTYEWTHPPLGKVTMMIGIHLFGMTPFGWRFMGALAGVLMVPLMYLLVRQLTKSTELSFVAMCLLALDAMHFTQTRIATIDSYAVFWIMLMYLFMFRYCQMNWNRDGYFRTLIPLGLCGITMGIAWATKWIGIYASAGLAVLFFWTLFCRLREYVFSRRRRAAEQSNAAPISVRWFWPKLLGTLLFCLIFFIVIPAAIYYFSYYWHLKGEGMARFTEMFTRQRLDRVIQIQKNIFNYHAGLGSDTHPFRSAWYQWPVIWWPMWYYSGTAYQPEGIISSISCMGNPVVWWVGLLCLLIVIVVMCCRRRALPREIMVVVGFASQFLPWVIVPRSTFIYHYFASVPFIIMATALMLGYVKKWSKAAFISLATVLITAALVLFVMFYPLESGLPVAREYAQHLRWFKWVNF